MTNGEIREATNEASISAEQLSAHLERLSARLAGQFPASADAIAEGDDEPRERLHAMLRMFEQLFDLTSRKLFRGLLSLSGETVAGLSAQNQFRRVEAIGGIENADRWLELAATRNALVHDYPVDPTAQAQRANRAWDDLPFLIAQTRRVIAVLRSEGLL